MICRPEAGYEILAHDHFSASSGQASDCPSYGFFPLSKAPPSQLHSVIVTTGHLEGPFWIVRAEGNYYHLDGRHRPEEELTEPALHAVRVRVEAHGDAYRIFHAGAASCWMGSWAQDGGVLGSHGILVGDACAYDCPIGIKAVEISVGVSLGFLPFKKTAHPLHYVYATCPV